MKQKWSVLDLALCAMGAAVLAVCAWITVPIGPVPFTLQTFGIFTVLGTLGGRRGSVSVGLYLLLGLVGLPVFAGFNGGAGALLGATGGFLLGFFVGALLYWLLTSFWKNAWGRLAGMALALLASYGLGTAWFCLGYFPEVGVAGALAKCVTPFVAVDLLKMALAWVVTLRLRQYVPEK